MKYNKSFISVSVHLFFFFNENSDMSVLSLLKLSASELLI